MKKMLPYLAGLALALVVYLIQETRIKELKEEVAVANAKVGREQKRFPRGTVKNTHAPSTAPTESDRDPSTVSKPDRNLKKTSDYGKGMAELFENEAGQAMIKQGIKMSLPMLYGDLVENFGLEPEEKKHFDQLLIDRMSTQQLLGMKWMQAEPEEKKELEKQMGEARELNSAAIDDFLNNKEDSEAFRKYEKQLPERQTLGGLRDSFADNPLPKETEENLVGLLYESRINSGGGDFGEDQIWATISETGNLDAVKERWEATDELIQSGLTNVLDEGQAKAFTKYWEGIRKMQAVQYNMALQMFQNQEK